MDLADVPLLRVVTRLRTPLSCPRPRSPGSAARRDPCPAHAQQLPSQAGRCKGTSRSGLVRELARDRTGRIQDISRTKMQAHRAACPRACAARKYDSPGDLRVFRASGGIRVFIDQAAQDGFSPDLSCVDAGRDGAGTVTSIVGDALGDALMRPGGVDHAAGAEPAHGPGGARHSVPVPDPGPGRAGH
jgi:hypothetical protein